MGHIQPWGKVNLGIAGANSDGGQCGVCVSLQESDGVNNLIESPSRRLVLAAL